ncbi:MAG: pyruvate kinase, partial [Ruminococcaceae bacterium]|nr:pyruvate kinase [Oscillospiraceae bacterium]
MKRTKIVCTVGPASNNEETLEKMLKAGMNVARYNFSHGDHKTHKRDIDLFRSIRDRLGLPAAVMLDSKGPEIRLGKFKNGSVELQKGGEIVLTVDEVEGDENIVSVSYKALPSRLAPGNRILVDDGKVGLEVLSLNDKEIKCKVLFGKKLSDRKSLNVPNVNLEMPFLSDADKSDFLFAIKMNVDYISASFTRKKEDVIELRKFLDYNGGHDIKIIAKIENIE